MPLPLLAAPFSRIVLIIQYVARGDLRVRLSECAPQVWRLFPLLILQLFNNESGDVSLFCFGFLLSTLKRLAQLLNHAAHLLPHSSTKHASARWHTPCGS
jgi:hypothetical protein